MCDARYFLVFDKEEMQIYDARTTKIMTSKPPVLKGWIAAEIEEIGTTTHDEWYGNLRDIGLTLDKWYEHVVTPESNEWINHIEAPQSDDSDEETRRGVMDKTIPSAVVDTGTTSNVKKFDCGLKLTGNPSTKIFITAT